MRSWCIKCLAVVLMMVCSLACFGIVATATSCSHPATEKVEGPITDLGDGEWLQECYKVCTSCGEIVDVFYRGGMRVDALIPSCSHTATETVEGPITDLGNGEWSQECYKVCTSCGETVDVFYRGGMTVDDFIPTACDHSDTRFVVTNEYYKADDENQHTKYEEGELICSLCSDVINPDYTSLTTGYDHRFNASGECVDCGYQKSCTHASTSVLCDSYDRRPLNEKQHELTQHMYTYCVDCGEKLNTYDDIEILEHEFSGDSCYVCGYTRATVCKHTNTQTYDLFTEYTPIEGNGEQHNQINHEKISCADCGEVINADKTSHLRSSHSFI